MLSDKERLILHFVSMMSIARVSGIECPDQFINNMIEDVRRNRCRSLTPEDVENILEEISEEMLAGDIMFREQMANTTWSMTGERPNKNTNWSDMR